MEPKIRIEELPTRSRPLHAEELSKVFGGCEGAGATCSQGDTKTCCNTCVEEYHPAIFNPKIPGSYEPTYTYHCN